MSDVQIDKQAEHLARLTQSLTCCCRNTDRSRAEAERISAPEVRVIERLSSCGRDNLVGLAAALGLTKGRVSRVVDALVSRGYVDRKDSEADRRYCVLQLTPKGKRAAERLRKTAVEMHRGLLEVLSAGERETCIGFMEALLGRMESWRSSQRLGEGL